MTNDVAFSQFVYTFVRRGVRPSFRSLDGKDHASQGHQKTHGIAED